MVRRNVRTITDLSKRLKKIGIVISQSNLGRLVDGRASYWSQELIEGMMTVLDCELVDLIR